MRSSARIAFLVAAPGLVLSGLLAGLTLGAEIGGHVALHAARRLAEAPPAPALRPRRHLPPPHDLVLAERATRPTVDPALPDCPLWDPDPSLGPLEPRQRAEVILSCIARRGDEIWIHHTAVDMLLEDQADLMRFARIVPEHANGRTVGVRIFGIRPGAALYAFGLRNGDSLRTINGFDVSQPERALEAYARLRSTSVLYVGFVRGEARHELRVVIV